MYRIWFNFADREECFADCPTVETARKLWDLLNKEEAIIMICTRP